MNSLHHLILTILAVFLMIGLSFHVKDDRTVEASLALRNSPASPQASPGAAPPQGRLQ